MTDAVTMAPTPLTDETTTAESAASGNADPTATEPAAGPETEVADGAGDGSTNETTDGEAAALTEGQAAEATGDGTSTGDSGTDVAGTSGSTVPPTSGSADADQRAGDGNGHDQAASEGGGAPQQSAGTGEPGQGSGLPPTGSVTPPANSAPPPAQVSGAPQGGGASFGTADGEVGAGLHGSGPNPPLNPGTAGSAQGRGPNQNPGAQPRGPIDLTETPAANDGPPIQGPTAPPPLPTPVFGLSSLFIEENRLGGTVGAVEVRLPAGRKFAYTVDDERFEMADGQLMLKGGESLDHETEPTVELTLTATDLASGKTYDTSFAISVTDVNEAPTAIALSASELDGLAGGALIGTLSTTDEDEGDTHSYDVDDDRFEIVDGNTLKLKNWAALDPTVEHEVELTITTTDGGGLEHSQALTVGVTAGIGGAFVAPLGEESLANTNTDGSQELRHSYRGGTSVAALADGGYVVTWLSSGGDNDASIRSQRFAADGQAVGDETIAQTLPDTTGGAPVVTGLANGGHLIAWVQQDVENSSIFGRFYDAEGQPIGQAEQLIDKELWNSGWTSIAVNGSADGGFVLAWADWGHWHDDNYGAGAQRFDAEGVAIGDTAQFGWWVEGISLAILADGGYVVVSQDMMMSTVYVVDAGGDTVRQFTPPDGFSAKVGALADGGFVLVQSDWMTGGLSAQRYDADGLPVGDGIVVTAAASWSGEFRVAGLEDGGFVTTWQTGNDVFGRVIDAAGDPVGDVFQAHDDATGIQTRPHVVGLADGSFAIVWDGQGAGDDQGVFSRVFTASGEQVLVGTAGEDVITGGAGNDTLFGMEGNDILEGGAGDDVLWGGPGADTFRVSSTGGIDTIMDFDADEGDVLDLSGLLNVIDANGQMLQAYLEIVLEDGDTLLSIDTAGQGDFAEPDAVVRFNDNDLIGDAQGMAQVIDNLLGSGALQVEGLVG